MPRDTAWLGLAARLAGLPLRLMPRRPFAPPRKAIILKPCCLSQVMLATPLLAALVGAFPEARFDWAICDWARPAVATNPRLTEIVSSGLVGLPGGAWGDVTHLIARLRAGDYDTAFIPSRSSLLAYVAWRAGIDQRVGLNVGWRGFAHSVRVAPPPGRHEAELYLELARRLNIDGRARMEFYPRDVDRAAVSARIVAEADWLGDRPLAILHPGGGRNPVRLRLDKRWPAERFALLGNYLVRHHRAVVLLVGDASDREETQAVVGMMTENAIDLTGTFNLGEMAALCEIADFFAGNDAGPTHVAAAVGCPTLAIFGPTDAAVSSPYVNADRLFVLAAPAADGAFTWSRGPSYEEAVVAADILLAARDRP